MTVDIIETYNRKTVPSHQSIPQTLFIYSVISFHLKNHLTSHNCKSAHELKQSTNISIQNRQSALTWQGKAHKVELQLSEKF